MAVPSAIASTKETATRASVAQRLRNSAPVLAWAMMACSTSGGGGSLALPTNRDAIHQVTKNTATDSRRITSAPWYRVIERARIKLRRRPDEVRSADLRQHAIEDACVAFFLSYGPARNPLAVTVTIDAQRGRVGGAGEGLNPAPLRIRGCENLLRLPGCRDESRKQVRVRVAPCLVEDVTDHRGRALGAKLWKNVIDAGQATEALGLQCRAEIPVVERGIRLAAQCFRGQERRRTIDDVGGSLQVGPVLFQRSLQQKPALVDRAAGDGERVALEIGQRSNGRVVSHHHRAQGARIGIERELAAERAFARN